MFNDRVYALGFRTVAGSTKLNEPNRHIYTRRLNLVSPPSCQYSFCEEPDECALGLVESFDHRLFVLQFARLQIATHFLFKFALAIQPIANDQPFIVNRLVVMLNRLDGPG